MTSQVSLPLMPLVLAAACPLCTGFAHWLISHRPLLPSTSGCCLLLSWQCSLDQAFSITATPPATVQQQSCAVNYSPAFLIPCHLILIKTLHHVWAGDLSLSSGRATAVGSPGSACSECWQLLGRAETGACYQPCTEAALCCLPALFSLEGFTRTPVKTF